MKDESPNSLTALTCCEQIKDEAFEETEKNFRMQERLIKSFIRDLSLYLQHIRVSVNIPVVTLMDSAFLCSCSYSVLVIKATVLSLSQALPPGLPRGYLGRHLLLSPAH